jgi:hypothetical protein
MHWAVIAQVAPAALVAAAAAGGTVVAACLHDVKTIDMHVSS